MLLTPTTIVNVRSILHAELEEDNYGRKNKMKITYVDRTEQCVVFPNERAAQEAFNRLVESMKEVF